MQTYIKAVQKLSQSVHAFAAYLSTLKVQLMLYNEKQLIMHFFTKLQSEIRKILLNYQDLLNKQDSLITLTVQLKSNLHTPDAMKLKKTFDGSCSRNTSGRAFSSID
jgi:aspartate carbamoyltransferase catalytic subunit